MRKNIKSHQDSLIENGFRQDISRDLSSIAADIFEEIITHSVNEELIDRLAAELVPVNKAADLWEAAMILGEFSNRSDISDVSKQYYREMISIIRYIQGGRAIISEEPTTVVFGTSGWRGVIGEDFTLLNVHKVTRAIIDMMKSQEFLKENGYESFSEVRQNGIVVFRDNRFMGDDFMDAAMKELAKAGIKIYLAKECPTGIGSALVSELGAAGSINFTPSHNPMNYAGLKFNPADGGPADKNLTDLIMKYSAVYMAAADFKPAENNYKYEGLNAAQIYKNFISRNELFDLEGIKKWLMANINEIYLVVDNMHGSSRGYLQSILGQDLIDLMEEAESIRFVNTEDDHSFHGVKPEPSAKNMQPLISMAKASGRELTLVCALDPDADRIRFGTSNSDIDMNKFGAIVYADLLARGFSGPIATTLPSSDFALAIARAEGQREYETPVGFKNFRPYRDAVVAFEESDGISFFGHTLEKDAVAGFLMALQVMRNNQLDIADYYQLLQQKYGYYYPEKSGVDVKGVSVEQWQEYKNSVVEVLQTQLLKTGDIVFVYGQDKKVDRISTDDGLKVVFEDNSWILLRPSGTEPKFRIYYEVVSSQPLANLSSIMAGYQQAGETILNNARAIVDAR